MSDTRLDEYDKEEMWDVARKLDPQITREQFDKDWREFEELKRKKIAERSHD